MHAGPAGTGSARWASLLCTVTPERYIGYFRELSKLQPGTDGPLNPADVLALMARYATDPYRP